MSHASRWRCRRGRRRRWRRCVQRPGPTVRTRRLPKLGEKGAGVSAEHVLGRCPRRPVAPTAGLGVRRGVAHLSQQPGSVQFIGPGADGAGDLPEFFCVGQGDTQAQVLVGVAEPDVPPRRLVEPGGQVRQVLSEEGVLATDVPVEAGEQNERGARGLPLIALMIRSRVGWGQARPPRGLDGLQRDDDLVGPLAAPACAKRCLGKHGDIAVHMAHGAAPGGRLGPGRAPGAGPPRSGRPTAAGDVGHATQRRRSPIPPQGRSVREAPCSPTATVPGREWCAPYAYAGRNGIVRATPQSNSVTAAHWARLSSIKKRASGGVWVCRLSAFIPTASTRWPSFGTARYIRRPSQPTARSSTESTCSSGARCSSRLITVGRICGDRVT